MSQRKKQCNQEQDYQIKQELDYLKQDMDYQRIEDAFNTNVEPLQLMELCIHRTATQASGRYKHITWFK